jgi:hypothetical protein
MPLSAADDPSEPRHLPERIRVSPGVLFQEIDGENVLMDTATEQFFSLDPMGAAIWILLNADPSIQATRTKLLETYEVTPEALEKDLTEFITRLIDAGLIAPE